MKYSLIVLALITGLNFVLPQPVKSQALSESPKGVKLSVSLLKKELSFGQPIPMTIKVTNTTDKPLKLLFANVTSYGLWAVNAYVTNLKTGKSAVEYHSRATLSSQIYSQDQLEKYYETLSPGKSLSREANVYDIAIVNFNDNHLPKGEYELQLYYYNIASNKIRFTIF